MSKVSANSELSNKRGDPNKRLRRFFSISYIEIANMVENFLICYVEKNPKKISQNARLLGSSEKL